MNMEWIPVTHKTPKVERNDFFDEEIDGVENRHYESEYVLVTKLGGFDGAVPEVTIAQLVAEYLPNSDTIDLMYWQDNNDERIIVSAWMPLPRWYEKRGTDK